MHVRPKLKICFSRASCLYLVWQRNGCEYVCMAKHHFKTGREREQTQRDVVELTHLALFY